MKKLISINTSTIKKVKNCLNKQYLYSLDDKKDHAALYLKIINNDIDANKQKFIDDVNGKKHFLKINTR